MQKLESLLKLDLSTHTVYTTISLIAFQWANTFLHIKMWLLNTSLPTNFTLSPKVDIYTLNMIYFKFHDLKYLNLKKKKTSSTTVKIIYVPET